MNTLGWIVVGAMVLAVLAGLWFICSADDGNDWDDFGGPYL